MTNCDRKVTTGNLRAIELALKQKDGFFMVRNESYYKKVATSKAHKVGILHGLQQTCNMAKNMAFVKFRSHPDYFILKISP